MFSEFNEAAQPKTSLAKYSIEFNDLAVQTRPHGIAFEAVRQTLLYVVGLSGGIGFKIPSHEAVVGYRGRRSIFLRSRRSIIEVAGNHRPRRSI